MKLRRIASLAVLAVVVSIAVATEGQAGGQTAISTCPVTPVTTSAYLTNDIFCAGSDGIVVAENGITIDLKGFTIRGNNTGHYGIYGNGFDQVTVKNGVVRNFGTGVALFGGTDRATVSSMFVSGSATYGVFVFGNSAKILNTTAMASGTFGIFVAGDSAKISKSTASGNVSHGFGINGNSVSISSATASGNGAYGITLSGDSASLKSVTVSANAGHGIWVIGDEVKVQSSTSSGNQGQGIVVQGESAQVNGNRAEGNGFAGGVPDTAGLGIRVYNFVTTPPVGTNIVRGNDDLDECEPLTLC